MRNLLTLFLLMAVAANARQISSGEAEAIASDFLNSSVNQLNQVKPVGVTRVRTKSGESADTPSPYFVFNADNNNGFVIVSGDDKARKILGYSDTGSFDANNIPSQLKWMLAQYEEEISNLNSSTSEYGIETEENCGDRQSIVPLIESRWGQWGVYNSNCPVVEGNKTPAGCVPIAIAQIMNYHKWPETGEETYSYQNYDGQTLFFDFQNTNFDWNLIQNTYDDSASDDSKAEVAKLIQAAGYASNTHYSYDRASGSVISYAKRGLVENLRYDSNARIVWRNNFSFTDWEDLIYDELSAGRPVFVSGNDQAGSGHAFVCDGYASDGLFHFNWGWDGDFDGFFAFSANTSNAVSYGLDMTALINIRRRDGERKDLTYDIIGKGNIKYFSPSEGGLGKIEISNIYNYSAKQFEGWVGCEYVNNETQESVFFPGNTSMLEKVFINGFYCLFSGEHASFFAKDDISDVNWSSQFGEFYLKFDIKPGTYTVYPAINTSPTMDSDTWQRLSCIAGGQSHLDLVVGEDFEFQYSNPGADVSPNIEITDIWINGGNEERVDWLWAHEVQSQLCFSYVNHSDYPISEVSYRIYDENGSYEGGNTYDITIEPNCEGGFSMGAIDLKPGKHEIKVFDMTGKQINSTPCWFEAKKRDYNLSATIALSGYEEDAEMVAFDCEIHNKSDEYVCPIMHYQFTNGIGEICRDTFIAGFEPNSIHTVEILKEKGFLIGDCTLDLLDPYGNRICETFKYQFPCPDVDWIGIELLNGSSLSECEMYIGESLQLRAVVLPEYAADKTVIWSSSNSEIATIDETGLVSGISVGTVTITAAANDGSGVSASCIVEVIERKMAGDLSGDGILDMTDANILKDHIEARDTSSLDPDVADMNHDGIIDMTDVNYIKDLILRNK